MNSLIFLSSFLFSQKYYLCCCRQSAGELVAQQEEHETLNDFIFEVDGNDQVGRIANPNVSEITHDDYDEEQLPVREVSIQSIFPDILGQEMERSQQSSSLQEPLLPQNHQ